MEGSRRERGKGGAIIFLRENSNVPVNIENYTQNGDQTGKESQ